MSQGERGLPGLPGDVVSTRKRPAAYAKLLLMYNIEYAYLSIIKYLNTQRIYIGMMNSW